MNPNKHTQRSATGGFSLFEIAVSLTILGLISGRSSRSSGRPGDGFGDPRARPPRGGGRAFRPSPSRDDRASPRGRHPRDDPGGGNRLGYPELKIGNSSTAFTFGEIVGSAEECILSLRPGAATPEGEPTFDLALSRPEFAPEDTTGSGMALRVSGEDFLQTDEEGRYWMPLLTGITSATWAYWDEDQNTWLDEWTDDSRLPPLLAFSFDDTYRPAPLRLVFEVPEQVSNPPAETTSTTGNAGSSTGTTGGGGNNGGGGGGRPGGGDGRPGGGDGRPAAVTADPAAVMADPAAVMADPAAVMADRVAVMADPVVQEDALEVPAVEVDRAAVAPEAVVVLGAAAETAEEVAGDEPFLDIGAAFPRHGPAPRPRRDHGPLPHRGGLV